VGETGLDFYRNLSAPGDQVSAFTGQIELARRFELPLIVHCRDAFAAVYEAVEGSGIGERTVLHCWTGGPRWTRRFLDLGCWFSFAGPVAFETGETVRRGAALVPPERALVETDTPYLTPPPHRDQPNEPAFVRLVGEALGQVWGLSTEAVAAHTSANAARIFRS
jgi:TatD DNase family protein